MDQIGVVGLSYRHAGVDEVARFAVPRAEVPARLSALRALLKASEILYVGTCNRVEVLYSTENGTPAGDLRQEVFRILTGREPEAGEAARILRAWTGEAAVEHLLLVACGLDSAQTGEREIAAQLRGAWEDAGIELVIVNRTLEAAEELAADVSGEALALDIFRRQPPAVSALILAAGSGTALLDAAALARLKGAAPSAPLLIDFGVPPNVDPDTARRAGIERVGMHELIELAQGRRLAQLVRLAPVRAAIDERLARLRTELALRAIGPRLAGLRETFEQIAAAEVARALNGQLRTLDARERAQLERLAATLAHRLAHLPLAGLRAAAVHASSDAVEAFFDGVQAPRRQAVNAADTEET